jgi:hypothetical protein
MPRRNWRCASEWSKRTCPRAWHRDMSRLDRTGAAQDTISDVILFPTLRHGTSGARLMQHVLQADEGTVETTQKGCSVAT